MLSIMSISRAPRRSRSRACRNSRGELRSPSGSRGRGGAGGGKPRGGGRGGGSGSRGDPRSRGTAVAHCPPHRPVLALLTHTVPTLDDDVADHTRRPVPLAV